MGLTDNHSIAKEIDSYFMTKGASDFNIYKDSFTQRCASLIWESFCRHYDFSHRYGNAAKNVNDFIEALKEFPYSDTIHIETIDTGPHVYLVQLKNGKWYLHEGSWYYFAVPLWNEMPRYLPNNIDIHDEAELMLAFDEYIPQIQVRAEEMKASGELHDIFQCKPCCRRDDGVVYIGCLEVSRDLSAAFGEPFDESFGYCLLLCVGHLVS